MTEFVAFRVQFFSFPVLFRCVLCLFPISCKASCSSTCLLWCATPVSHWPPHPTPPFPQRRLTLSNLLTIYPSSLFAAVFPLNSLKLVFFWILALSFFSFDWFTLLPALKYGEAKFSSFFFGYLLNMSVVPPVRWHITHCLHYSFHSEGLCQNEEYPFRSFSVSCELNNISIFNRWIYIELITWPYSSQQPPPPPHDFCSMLCYLSPLECAV